MMKRSTLDSAIIAYTRAVIRFRWWVIVFTVALGLLLTSGLRNLVYNADYRVLFAEDNARLLAYEEVQNAYANNDTVLFVVTAKGGELFDRRVLEAVAHLTEASWQIPHAIRVDSLTNYQYARAEEDDLFVESLIPGPASMSDAELAEARKTAFEQPALVNRLIREGSAVTAINVVVQAPEEAQQKLGERCTLAAREIAAEASERFPEVEVLITGVLPLNYAFLEATRHDLWNLIPIMNVIMIVTMALLLRSVALMLAAMLVTSLSMGSAMGLLCTLGFEVSGPVAPAPVMIMTLAVANSIHILVSLQWYLSHHRDKYEALVEAMRVNVQPVFVTSLTTGIGFLSMNLNHVPPIQLLGNVTAGGMVFAFFFSVLLLPALVAVLPVRRRESKDQERPPIMVRLGEWVIARRLILIAAFGVMVVMTSIFIPRIPINNQFIAWLDERMPIRQATDYTMENLTGIYQLTFSVPAKDEGGICEPEYLEYLEDFTHWAEVQPGVTHVQAFTEKMKQLNKSMHGDDPSMYRVPASRELAAQYLVLYEMSLPAGLDLNTEINVDKSATRVIVTLANLRSEQVEGLGYAARDWIRDHLPEYMHTEAVGPGMIFAEISRTMMQSMLYSTPLALALVSLSLVFALRSVSFGMLSLVPNLMPLAMGFGVWGLFRWDMNFSMSSVTAMGIGIVVDDTVHFMSKYLRSRREQGFEPVEAVRYAYASVGKAMWVTSFVLVAGFSVLTLSLMQYCVSMGLLTGMVIVFALGCDLLFLPSLLLQVDRFSSVGTHRKEANHDE